MKKEYDFSHADQGRFYTKPEDLEPPHYLTPELEGRLRRMAQRQGKDPEELLRGFLARELALHKKIGEPSEPPRLLRRRVGGPRVPRRM